jgi:uncharacterized protein YbaR (Trm112 family)
MSFDDRLLGILVCPRCKGALQFDSPETGLICRACCLAYPVRDGIPIMLEAEAKRVDK